MMANEPEAAPREDGTIRRAHYGSGRQPWDDILAAGWAPEFAAGSVLKYLRRTKDPEHSLESARWYWARIIEGIANDRLLWQNAYYVLVDLLTQDEIARLA